MIKKLNPKVKFISCMDVHPGGDNVLVGSFDRKISWFDTDLGSMPYRTLTPHKESVRQVAYVSLEFLYSFD